MSEKRLIVACVAAIALAALAGAVWLFSVNQETGAAAVLPIAGTALGLLAPSLLAHPRADDEPQPVEVQQPDGQPIPVDPIDPLPVPDTPAAPRRRPLKP